MFSVGRDGEETGVLNFGGKIGRRQFAAGRIKSRNVNALALGPGVGAEINKVIAGETDRGTKEQADGSEAKAFHAIQKTGIHANDKTSRERAGLNPNSEIESPQKNAQSGNEE